MASSGGAIRAGRAFVELFCDTSRLMKGLKNAAAMVSRFAGSVNKLGKQMFRFGIRATAAFAGVGYAIGRAFGDTPEMQELNAAWTELGNTLRAALLPMMQAIVPQITALVKAGTEWIANNAGLVQSIVKIGAILAGVSAAVTLLGAAMALVTNPIALLVAGLAAAGAAWIAFSDTGQQSWGLIVEAVQAGDIGAAIETLITGIRKSWSDMGIFMLGVWTEFIANAEKFWVEFSTWFKSTLAKIQGAAADILIDVGVAIGLIEGDADDIKNTRQEDTARSLGGLNEIKQQRLKDIEAARSAMQDTLGEVQFENDKEFQKELAGIRARLPEAKPAEFQAAMAGAVAGSGRTLGSQGTFNPFAASSLGANVDRQQLDVMKQQLKELAKIDDSIKRIDTGIKFV